MSEKRTVYQIEFDEEVARQAAEAEPMRQDEPFGYFCECKGADPAFLRKPSWIPPTDALHTTTPLYALPFPSHITALKDIVRAWEALPRGRQQPMRSVEKWLADEMAPSINRIRAALSALEERGS